MSTQYTNQVTSCSPDRVWWDYVSMVMDIDDAEEQEIEQNVRGLSKSVSWEHVSRRPYRFSRSLVLGARKQQLVVSVRPRVVKGRARQHQVRLEFVPSKFSPRELLELRKCIRRVLGFTYYRFTCKAHVTAIDLACDFDHVNINTLVFSLPRKRKWACWGLGNTIESMRIGHPRSGSIRIYDKQKQLEEVEKIHIKHPILRVETCFRFDKKQCVRLKHIPSLCNRISEIVAYDLSYARRLRNLPRFFPDSCRLRTVRVATRMMPRGRRNRIVRLLRKSRVKLLDNKLALRKAFARELRRCRALKPCPRPPG